MIAIYIILVLSRNYNCAAGPFHGADVNARNYAGFNIDPGEGFRS